MTQPQSDFQEFDFKRLLSAKEIGARLGVSPETVRRWYHCGLPTGVSFPEHLVRRRGFGEILFDKEVISIVLQQQKLFGDR